MKIKTNSFISFKGVWTKELYALLVTINTINIIIKNILTKIPKYY